MSRRVLQQYPPLCLAGVWCDKTTRLAIAERAAADSALPGTARRLKTGRGGQSPGPACFRHLPGTGAPSDQHAITGEKIQKGPFFAQLRLPITDSMPQYFS
jgi:hypothetical protein